MTTHILLTRRQVGDTEFIEIDPHTVYRITKKALEGVQATALGYAILRSLRDVF